MLNKPNQAADVVQAARLFNNLVNDLQSTNSSHWRHTLELMLSIKGKEEDLKQKCRYLQVLRIPDQWERAGCSQPVDWHCSTVNCLFARGAIHKKSALRESPNEVNLLNYVRHRQVELYSSVKRLKRLNRNMDIF